MSIAYYLYIHYVQLGSVVVYTVRKIFSLNNSKHKIEIKDF